jgi:hypothetical protein
LGNGLAAAHYRADFRGLDAASKYCYRVGDGKSWSEWSFFRTASATPEETAGDEPRIATKALAHRSLSRR